jgi:hypothetical protein
MNWLLRHLSASTGPTAALLRAICHSSSGQPSAATQSPQPIVSRQRSNAPSAISIRLGRPTPLGGRQVDVNLPPCQHDVAPLSTPRVANCHMYPCCPLLQQFRRKLSQAACLPFQRRQPDERRWQCPASAIRPATSRRPVSRRAAASGGNHLLQLYLW